jgi:peptidoglycan-N-acetylglucosamine deacetylase
MEAIRRRQLRDQVFMRSAIRNLAKSNLQRISAGRFLYRITNSPALFLTFDDGPHPDHTPRILDILNRHAIKATFFLVGRNAEAHPELVRRISADGHTIGLHTHTHVTLDRMTHAQFISEISSNQRAIFAASGLTPKLLRPPEGRFKLRNIAWAASQDLCIVHFTVTSNDWKARSAAEVLDQLSAANVHPGDILSLHDTVTVCVEALPLIIQRFQSGGSAFHSI